LSVWLVITAEAGIQRLFFWWLLEQKLPPQAAGNFLLNGKKSPKNVFDLSRCLLSADSTSVLLAADRAHPCARSPSLQARK
jgi:hypothetical protein